MSDNYKKIAEYYEKCLDTHGDNHRGIDWPDLDDLHKRYKIMIEVIRWAHDTNNRINMLDFGCGTAYLNEYLQAEKISNIDYSGLDISPKFIDICKAKFPDFDFYCLDILQDADALPAFDYIILNGVFTEKCELTFEEMFLFFQEMIKAVFAKARGGVAFNVMSKAVDWEREDLFHLSTDLLIAFLTKNVTRKFIIRNDYGLYEYTTYIYKQ
jgi:SAM-dependent methyltransferase